MSETYDIELQKGFPYHSSGSDQNAKFIRISPFNMRQRRHATGVRELIFHAIGRIPQDEESAKMTKHEREMSKDDKEKEEKITSKALMALFTMYCNQGDSEKLESKMAKLLTMGVAYIDGEDVKFSETHIDSMVPSEFMNLCWEYIVNFIHS